MNKNKVILDSNSEGLNSEIRLLTKLNQRLDFLLNDVYSITEKSLVFTDKEKVTSCTESEFENHIENNLDEILALCLLIQKTLDRVTNCVKDNG